MSDDHEAYGAIVSRIDAAEAYDFAPTDGGDDTRDPSPASISDCDADDIGAPGASDEDDAGAAKQAQHWGYSVERLNEEWALALVGSKAVMVRDKPDAPIEDRVRIIQIEAFRALYANRFTQILHDAKIKTITWSKRWETDRDRRQFDGIEFFPNHDGAIGTPGYLNLWRGFSIVPDAQAGSYAIFRDHVFTNICGGDEQLFAWVFGWFAHLIQRPRERIGTALVVRGLMGTGKTVLGEVMGSLIEQHYFMVDDPRYITGQFNAHMAACLLLQAEEAVWAGDKAAEGRLKGLVTSKTQMIESKGVDPFRIDNYVRLVMTSNEDWVVPAGKDERRFCVLDVSPTVKENHGYFKEMFAELGSGGREALLADLLAFDVDAVNLRKIPKTQSLLEQKIRSLDHVESFLFERLWEGNLVKGANGWPPGGLIRKEKLFDYYLEVSDKVGVKRRSEQTVFGMKLQKLLPGVQVTKRMDEEIGGTRAWFYEFPTIVQCREAFQSALGQKVDWPDGDDDGTDPQFSDAGETGFVGYSA